MPKRNSARPPPSCVMSTPISSEAVDVRLDIRWLFWPELLPQI
jgi:hypothetical protein